MTHLSHYNQANQAADDEVSGNYTGLFRFNLTYFLLHLVSFKSFNGPVNHQKP